MITNSTNINKTNNHLSPLLNELKKTTIRSLSIYANENPYPGCSETGTEIWRN